MSNNCSILLTIDVEDWFQVENFKPWIPFSSWSSHELRVEKNTHRLLDLLDSQQSAVSSQGSTVSGPPSAVCRPPSEENGPRTTDNGHGVKPRATFFVLGWIAERLPHLVREIHTRGHEVASHGYYHKLCNECSSKDVRADLIKSKKLLEDIIGAPVVGYRAPSFAIDDDILKTIEECGYNYDSSSNSFGMHSRYGHIDLSRNSKKGIAVEISNNFYELPISNMALANRIFPLGGGGYFRLIPFSLFKKGVQSILKKENACLFYMHPWEIDPDQPKVNEASKFYKFRHYVNLSKTYSKLSKFLESFNQCHFVTAHQYLAEMTK
jgi:polysaccharide deacetylase family protein (PEP-CTERM system associated)